MDHSAPPWINQSRPAAGMPPWRGMYPPPSLHPYRTSDYGYYQQYPMQGGNQAWHGPWMDYHSRYPANMPRHVETRRPASRAEIYEKSDRREPYRPLSRQEYDERYGFYEAVHRENYGNRNYRYDPTAIVSAETDWRRETHNQHMEHWMQNPPNVYNADQNLVNQQQIIVQDRIQRYDNSNAWHSSHTRCSSATEKIESFSSNEPSLLSQYRDSGMSSSSYELSQYMHDPADVIDYWNPLQDETLECTPQPTAPMKFSLPHVTVCFGAQGQMVRVCPNFPDEGQPALVEIHSMEVLLSDTAEQEEMRNFPGPVQRSVVFADAVVSSVALVIFFYGDPKWGDWKPHLAVMLSNQMGEPEVNNRAIVTMGDHLVLKGFTKAGHCCYLTAGIPLGQFYKKSDRLVLLGSNHNQTFKRFASTANIQCTEILEYCQSLGKPVHFIPSFQVYKFLYATRLLDYGLTSLALHYCECIAYALLSSGSGSSVLISELIKLADRLKYSDPQILEQPEPEQNQETLWLVQLRALLLQFQTNDEKSRTSPLTCSNQVNKTETVQQNKPVEVLDVPTLGEALQRYPEDETGHSLQNAAEEEKHIGSWVPQYTDLQLVDAQSGHDYVWGSQQSEFSADPPSDYNTPEEPQAQETLEEFSESPTHSSNNAFLMQAALMSRRVSTVSETSTVSVEDDNGEERFNDEALAQKSEEKKGSTFGWFSWFRSKPTKEIPIPSSNPQTAKSLSQAESPPRPDDKRVPPPPAFGYLPPDNTMNLSSRGIKVSEDRQKINNTSVLPEIRGQREKMGIYPNASVSGSPISQPPGAVPLYNPSQFLQDASRSSNQPRRPPRGRYPQQPR
ncbi:protein transport protein Sec16B [Aquarana catesbeiana]|uniref:protein transport protein Sec16B n=1 Tax=Aquarana catesbeiana TaxID=8400 RepID=UPI003CC9AB6F